MAVEAEGFMGETERVIDARIEIVTPENIAFQYTVAGPIRRLPAFLIDVFVGAFLFFSTLAATILFIAWLGFEAAGIGLGLTFVLYFALVWFYGAYFETFWNGQTPGKHFCRLRVLSDNGRPITAPQAILRNLLRWVEVLPFVPIAPFSADAETEISIYVPIFAVGLVATLVSNRYQRLGDIAAGTIVVLDERTFRLTLLKSDDAAVRHIASQFPSDFRTTPRLSTALAAYVERRPRMSPARREEVASQLANELRTRLRVSASLPSDLLLMALYHFLFHSQSDEEAGAKAASLEFDLPPPTPKERGTKKSALFTARVRQ